MVVRLKDIRSGQTSENKNSGMIRLSDIRKKEEAKAVESKKIEDGKQAAAYKQEEQKFGTPILDPSQTPVMQQINYSLAHPAIPPQELQSPAHNNVPKSAKPVSNTDARANDKSRKIPVIGSILHQLDRLSDTTTQHVIANVGETLYTPGGTVANIAGFTGAVGRKLAEKAPNLVGSVAGRIAQTAIKEGSVGFPLGIGQYQAMGGDDTKEALKHGALGATLGGALGSLGGTVVESIAKINKNKLAASFDKMFPAYEQAAKNRNIQELNKTAPKQSGPILGLPEPKSAIMAREAQNRSVLPANTDVIHGQGNIETLGLPQGQYTAPTRLKVSNPTETLDYVMTKIKPQVMEIIEAPARRDQLIKYLNKNGYEMNDLVNRPMKTLQEHGELVQAKLHGNMQQIAFDVAKQQGHDLPTLLEGQAPTLRNQIAKDAQSQVYGVPAPRVGIQKPDFNVTHNADAAMPITKIGRPSTLREEVAAKVKPKVETVTPKTTVTPRVEVVGKPEPLKARTEVQRTVTPSQRVSGIRANYQNQLKNGNFSPELQAKIKVEDQSYEKLTNKASDDVAKESVKNISKAESNFNLNESGGADHIATGYRLMQKLDSMGEHERALIVSKKLAADLTKAGQTAQAARVIQRLSPEGRLLDLVRTAERNGKEVTEAHNVEYKELAKEAQSSGLTKERSSEVMDIFDRAKKGEKISSDDHATLNELIKDINGYVKSKNGSVPKEAKLSPKLEQKAIRDKVLNVLNEQETKVLERMRARGNRLSSLPLDVYADYALLGSIKLAKGAISFSKWSEQMIKDIGNDIKPHLSPIYEKAQRLLDETTNKITDIKVNNAEKVAEKFIKEGNISPKDEQMLRDLSKKMNEMSGESIIKADMKMQQILNSYRKSDLGAKIATIRYMEMLLNTLTQMINAGSGPVMMTYNHMLDIIATPLNIAWSKVMKTDRVVTFKQGPGLADGMFQTVVDWFKGLKVGAKAGFHGVDPEGIASQHDIRGLTFPGKLNPLGWGERALGVVAKGPDYATFSATRKAELRKLAYLDAINKGIKGDQNIRNYMSKYLSNTGSQGLEQASRIGKNTTFQNTEGVAGKMASAARKVNELTGSKDLGVANAIVPFIRTPTNIAIKGIENTPAGILKGLFELNRLRKGATDISKREILKTFVSATAGGTAIIGSLGYVLSDLGIITGDYTSTNKNVNGLQDAIGKGKFRFNTDAFGRMFDALVSGEVSKIKEVSQFRKGDNQFDYNRLQPLAFPLAAGATFADQRKAAKFAEARGEKYPLSKQLAKSGASAGSSLFGMSSLQGLTNTFRTDVSSDSPQWLQIGQNIAEAFVKGFSSSAAAQEAKRQDPIQRETTFNQSIGEDLGTYFKSRTPGQSQSLPPKVTNLGDTKTNSLGVSGQYVNPLRSEKVNYNDAAEIIYSLIQRTGNEKLAPVAMEKSVEGRSIIGNKPITVKLTKARYAKLQEDTGKAIVAKILALPKYMSDEDLSKKLEKIYSDVRETERNKVKKEFGIKRAN